MNSQKVNDWLQLVGLLGLIASLLFVGFQIKQTQDIAEANTSLTRAWTTGELHIMRASSPTLNSAFAKLWVGAASQLRPDELVALYWHYLAVLKVAESNFDQYQRGYLTLDRWQVTERDLLCLFSTPVFREMESFDEYTDTFREVLLKVHQEAGTSPSACNDYDPGSIWDWGDRLDQVPPGN